jgi:Ca-activated chloride channel homolog
LSFLYFKYLPLALIGIIVLIYFFMSFNKKYFSVIEKHWFFKQTTKNKLSNFFFYGFLALSLFALLDLRGPVENIESNIPDQKTIIIVDSSASMLVEDVRPNRYRKALIMARHFIKKSVGHKVAVVLFSDSQKRLVPFTDDLDLLDSRIAALETFDITSGGSNIAQAVTESVQYFKTNADNTKNIVGNILVFTDSERNDENLKAEIPDGINLAMVGVGTIKGGPIPIRDRNGTFRGYKKFKGEVVTSRLDEGYLKSFSKLAKNYKYWVALSYSIPTEEILGFFKKIHLDHLSKGTTQIRPVLKNFLLIPAMILLFLSGLFSQAKTYLLPVLIFACMPQLVKAAPDSANLLAAAKDTAATYHYLLEFKEGELKRDQKLKLAEYLLKAKKSKEAKTLYQEQIKDFQREETNVLFNYGTSLLASGEVGKGVEVLHGLKTKIGKDDLVTADMIKTNILLALKQQKNKKKKDQDKKKKDKKDKKKKKQDEKGKQGKKDQKKQQKKDNKNKKNEQSKGKKQKDKNKSKKEQAKDRKKQWEKHENDIKKKRKMVKIPAMIKQILNDDRNLQKQFYKTKNRKKHSPRDNKDW